MIDNLYQVVGLAGFFILVYVMQQCEHDIPLRSDTSTLQLIRKTAFVITGWALLYGIVTLDFGPVMIAGVCNLAVNASSLHRRARLNKRGDGHSSPAKQKIRVVH